VNSSTPSPRSRIMRGYGPLVAFALVFLLMALFFPTVGRKVVNVNGVGAAAGPAGDELDTNGGSAGRAGTAGQAGVGGVGGWAGAGVARGAPPPGSAGACPDRKQQVSGDTYSPPCVAFSGSNGGATTRGVSGDTITVAVRVTNDPGFQQALAQAAGAQLTDTEDDVKRTTNALVDYFNSHFQFYGRKIKLDYFDGKGSALTELQGGGQEEAQADAITVSDQIKAFAELNGGTEPYADALARRQVVNFGAPYLSREWLTQRRPYSWSVATDCSIITESVSTWILARLGRRPAAWAGGDLENKPRKYAVIAPENPWYQECVDAGQKILAQHGEHTDDRLTYKFDINSLSDQAANMVAKLKSDHITSVVLGVDPILPVFLTAKAKEQDYQPEWLVAGTALTDVDLVGQLYDQDQWSHAFGISYLGSYQPLRASYGYNAYKAVQPNNEPAQIVDIIYYQLYMLALGIQLAGPNLTPQTFERGMFSYPGGTGPAGHWGFGPGEYTPTQDAREIYWDRNKVSTQNNKQGAYIEVEPGKRYKSGQWPQGDPPVFVQQ
jgi:hypothetical protein